MNAATIGREVNTRSNEHKNEHLILAEIVFGDPSQVYCSGVGICRLLPSNLHRSPHIPSISAALIFLHSGGIELRLQRSDLPETLYHRQFSGGFFQVQTALRLPRWLQKKMPAGAPVTISSGYYPCRETASCLTIILHQMR